MEEQMHLDWLRAAMLCHSNLLVYLTGLHWPSN